MAFNISVTSKYRPFTYEDYIKPLEEYWKDYEAHEEALSQLQSNAEALEYIVNSEPEGSKLKTLYQGYLNQLNEAANALDKGYNAEDRALLRNLKSSFASDILPITTGYTNRKAMIDEQRRLKAANPSVHFDRLASNASVTDFIENPNWSYNSFVGDAITSKVQEAVAPLSLVLNEVKRGKSIAGYASIIKQYGVSPKDIEEYIENGGGKLAKYFSEIEKQAIESFGIQNWGDEEAMRAATSYAHLGLYKAVGRQETELRAPIRYPSAPRKPQAAKPGAPGTPGGGVTPGPATRPGVNIGAKKDEKKVDELTNAQTLANSLIPKRESYTTPTEQQALNTLYESTAAFDNFVHSGVLTVGDRTYKIKGEVKTLPQLEAAIDQGVKDGKMSREAAEVLHQYIDSNMKFDPSYFQDYAGYLKELGDTRAYLGTPEDARKRNEWIANHSAEEIMQYLTPWQRDYYNIKRTTNKKDIPYAAKSDAAKAAVPTAAEKALMQKYNVDPSHFAQLNVSGSDKYRLFNKDMEPYNEAVAATQALTANYVSHAAFMNQIPYTQVGSGVYGGTVKSDAELGINLQLSQAQRVLYTHAPTFTKAMETEVMTRLQDEYMNMNKDGDNGLYIIDPSTGVEKKVKYSKDEINKIFSSASNLVFSTDYGLLIGSGDNTFYSLKGSELTDVAQIPAAISKELRTFDPDNIRGAVGKNGGFITTDGTPDTWSQEMHDAFLTAVKRTGQLQASTIYEEAGLAYAYFKVQQDTHQNNVYKLLYRSNNDGTFTYIDYSSIYDELSNHSRAEEAGKEAIDNIVRTMVPSTTNEYLYPRSEKTNRAYYDSIGWYK